MSQDLSIWCVQSAVMAGPFVGTFASDDPMRVVSFGAWGGRATENDFKLKNLKVGTNWGASDIWNPSFTTTVAPPFDSVEGDAAAMTIDAVPQHPINVANDPAADVYGVIDLGDDYIELFVTFDVDWKAVMWDQDTSDVMDVWTEDLDALVGGIYADNRFYVINADVTPVDTFFLARDDDEDLYGRIYMRFLLGGVPPTPGGDKPPPYHVSERLG